MPGEKPGGLRKAGSVLPLTLPYPPAPDLETGRSPGLGTEEKAFLVSWPLSEEGEDAHFVYCKDMAPPHHTPTVSYSQLGCPRDCVDEGELHFCM